MGLSPKSFLAPLWQYNAFLREDLFFRHGFLNITVQDSLRVGGNRGWGEGREESRVEGTALSPSRELPSI